MKEGRGAVDFERRVIWKGGGHTKKFHPPRAVDLAVVTDNMRQRGGGDIGTGPNLSSGGERERKRGLFISAEERDSFSLLFLPIFGEDRNATL